MPVGRVGLLGVTVKETTVALVTLTLVDEEDAPEEAVMTALPAAMPLTRPEATVATAGWEELQLTESETFWMVPSVSFATAAHCSSVLKAMEASGQVTDNDTTAAGVMVTALDPVRPEMVALIVVFPGESGESSPAALMAPILVSEECQLTPEVRFFALPSE